MSAISNPLRPADSFTYLNGGTLDCDIATARKFSELFLRGDADLADVTAAIELWLSIDEQLRDPGLAKPGVEGKDHDFNEAADEWPCTLVEARDPNWTAAPWIDFGPAGDAGKVDDKQLTTAWGRRFVRQGLDQRWRVLTAVVYAAGDAEDGFYFAVRAHFAICDDYRKGPVKPTKKKPGDWTTVLVGELTGERVPEQDYSSDSDVYDGTAEAPEFSIDKKAATKRARELCDKTFSADDEGFNDWDGQAFEDITAAGSPRIGGFDVSW